MSDRNISCGFPDKDALYRAYMPFIKNGGLFIRTDQIFNLDEEITLEVRLLNEDAPRAIKGKIVWKTPLYAQNNFPAGIGVQFVGSANQDESVKALDDAIKNYLADMMESDKLTDTL